MFAITIAMTFYGSGIHIWELDEESIEVQHWMGQFVRILYPPIVACVRISILLFMRRLSPSPSVHFFTLSLIILNGLVAIICICLLLFNCTPVIAFFIMPIDRPSNTICLVSELQTEEAIPILNACLDFVVWLVPAIMLARVHFLNWKKKVAHIALLGLGLLACIPSVLRIPLMPGMIDDITWKGIPLNIWTVAEVSIGIIAASVPALWPLVTRAVKKAGMSWGSKWWGQSKSAKGEVELEVRDWDQEAQRWREEQPRRTHSTEPLYGYPGYPRSLMETKAGHSAVSLVTPGPPTQEQQQRRESEHSEHSDQKRESTNSVANLVPQPEQQERRPSLALPPPLPSLPQLRT